MISMFHPDSKTDLYYTFKVGFYSFLHKCMGWWAFDVFTQLAATLGQSKFTAGQTILRNIGLFTYMIPVGLSAASAYIIGNLVGKKDVVNARLSYNLCMSIAFVWSLISMLLVWTFEDEIQDVYTNDDTVKKVMTKAWFALTIFVFFDCM